MRVAKALSLFALLLIFSVSAYALQSKCVAVGPAAADLSVIANAAADAQKQADEIWAYLRTTSPDWRTLASQTAYLAEDVRTIQKQVADFERREPKLTPAQSQQLERLKAGLATLTVFLNNTNRIIAEQRVWPHREELMANARAMQVRAGIIREAARNLRVSESA
jgi:septal ring factor EnvC (AmiA/AmiB activator)